MPIRPEKRAYYPKNWPHVRDRILQRANGRCEWCGVKNYAIREKSGDRVVNSRAESHRAAVEEFASDFCSEAPNDYAIIVLTIAHLNHDPTDNRDENLAALCQRCHNRHDVKHRANTRGERKLREAAAAGQLQLLNIARRQVEVRSAGVCDEPWYRLVLRNVGGAQPDADGHVSAKTLDHVGFERVMAFLEQHGFRERGRSETHWRDRDSRRTGLATSRQVWAIHQLYADYAKLAAKPYPLDAIVRRATNGWHGDVAKLPPALAQNVIEALKGIVDRLTCPTSFDSSFANSHNAEHLNKGGS